MNALLKKKNFIYVLVCICMAALISPISAFGQVADGGYQLAVKYPAEGAEVSVYRVAEYTEEESFKLTDQFAAYREKIKGLDDLENNPDSFSTDDWMGLAESLNNASLADEIEKYCSGNVDGNGMFSENVERGLYLVSVQSVINEDKVYSSSPVLVTLPRWTESGEQENSVTLDFSGKVLIEDIKDEYRVEKIWKDDSEDVRPDSIEAVLTMDYSEIYDTVELNADNNWRYVWEDLPAGHEWGVYEKAIPEGYQVSYEGKGAVMYIENHYTPSDETPPEENLPQTGQLWWPVPVLIVLGLGCFVAGWLRFNSGEK